ncbi:glutaminase A [Kribbella sp. NPDC026611]|uniref:glutaminase A n=1 Tax=Kribbella sp. NPDC026611 TaxID=3154911 RepID=UPI003401C3F4
MAEFDVESLFRSFDTDRTNVVWKWKLLAELERAGLRADDPRVEHALPWVLENVGAGADARIAPFERGQPEWLDRDQFQYLLREPVIRKALTDDLAMPTDEFAEFTQGVEEIYADLLDERSGEVADYIPTLATADPEQFGIAVCTADGQVFMIGDAENPFSVQSTSKPFSYAMALEEHGADFVHQYVGQEQSGGPFNDPLRSLDASGRPHNPMINAGAIGTLALVDADLDDSKRFEKLQHTWSTMAGARVRMDEPTFLGEQETGHNNRMFASAMAGRDTLYKRSNRMYGPIEATDFYFRVCSLEVDARRLAAAGATLAGGGVAPYKGQRVFSQENTRRVLKVMEHSGMYNDSGKFSGKVGLPAKSGVSGNVLMVVPSKRLAVVAFSPRLDPVGNSVRGVQVCERLVEKFDLHPLQDLGADKSRAAEAAHRVALGGVATAGAPGERTTTDENFYGSYEGGAAGRHRAAAPATTNVTRAGGPQL